MKKNKNFIIGLLLFLIIRFIVILSCYYIFKPINIKSEIIRDSNIDIVLNKRLNKCLVNLSIEKNSDIDIIDDYLLKDNYLIKNNRYKKNFYINSSCNNVMRYYKNINIKEEKKKIIEAGNEYTPDDLNNKYKGIKLLKKADSSKLGTDYDIYEIDNYLFKKYLLNQVLVKDTIPPVITLTGKKEVSLYVNNKYIEEGYNVIDSFEGELTNKVSVESNIDYSNKGTYSIKYTVVDSSGNSSFAERKITIKEKPVVAKPVSSNVVTVNNLTYINGILLVNKKYGLPEDYNPGVNQEALAALNKMQSDASNLGLNLKLVSGFRSYQTQKIIYNNYVKKDGEEKANMYSAKPGHSEHQTGLAFDVGSTKGAFANTAEGKWLAENCHLYGFIIRYPYGKTGITGYIYEPWHIRYLGVDIASKIKNSNLTLEEYLGVN